MVVAAQVATVVAAQVVVAVVAAQVVADVPAEGTRPALTSDKSRF